MLALARLGHREQASRSSAATASTELTTKIEPHHHCSSSAPPTSIPRMPPAPAKPAHTPTALARPSGGKTLVIVDSVPGMISAAPTPVSARHAMSAPAESLNAEAALATPKMAMPSDERPAAAEAVAERAGREEQCGQRDGVAVDDPLLVARRRAERGGERRNRDGHHRDAGHDQHEGQQHGDEHGGAPTGGDRLRLERRRGADQGLGHRDLRGAEVRENGNVISGIARFRMTATIRKSRVPIRNSSRNIRKASTMSAMAKTETDAAPTARRSRASWPPARGRPRAADPRRRERAARRDRLRPPAGAGRRRPGPRRAGDDLPALVDQAGARHRRDAPRRRPRSSGRRPTTRVPISRRCCARWRNDIFGPKSCFVVGFITALRNDPELGRVFRESLLTEMRDQLRRPIARVLGDDDPDLDLRVDLAPAFLIFRTLDRRSARRPRRTRAPPVRARARFGFTLIHVAGP